jgi:vacuolar-type H+-ATPase subunit C/Vma6
MKHQRANLGSDFINAKVHGMRSKLLEAGRLSELADSRSLPELFRRTHPGSAFEGHLQFESEIVRNEVRQFDLILGHLSGRIFHLFQWLMTAYQLENLKVALRFYVTREGRAAAERLATPVPKWLALPMERLFDAPDLARFVRAVPEPLFQRALDAALAESPKADLFTLDMTLDCAYIEHLNELAAGADEWSRRLAGFDVDRRCLLMLLRARFNYNRSFEQIAPFFTPARAFLTARSAQQIILAPDLKEAIHRIPNAAIPEALRASAGSLTRVEDLLFLAL